MSTTIIDTLYTEHVGLVNHLLEAGELSLLNNVDAGFRKALLLSAASYFEVQVRDSLLAFMHEKTAGNEVAVAFVKNKAIERQYHSYFNWSDKNANQFFGMFGPAFKARMELLVQSNQELDAAIKAFLELGNLRNRLVHRDYATFPMDKTVDEIYKLYKSALGFVEALPASLREPA